MLVVTKPQLPTGPSMRSSVWVLFVFLSRVGGVAS